MNGLNVFRIVLRNCLENMENAVQCAVGCKKMVGRGVMVVYIFLKHQ